jgi:hypothetical protein
LQAGGNSRKRAEVATELDEPRTDWPGRELFAQDAQRPVRASIHDKDDLQRLRHAHGERLQLRKKPRKVRLVLINGNHQG